MWCPNCHSEKTRVIGTDKSYVVTRFRRCNECGYTFSTIESHKFDTRWQENAQYSDEEVKRILAKRKKHGQMDMLEE